MRLRSLILGSTSVLVLAGAAPAVAQEAPASPTAAPPGAPQTAAGDPAADTDIVVSGIQPGGVTKALTKRHASAEGRRT